VGSVSWGFNSVSEGATHRTYMGSERRVSIAIALGEAAARLHNEEESHRPSIAGDHTATVPSSRRRESDRGTKSLSSPNALCSRSASFARVVSRSRCIVGHACAGLGCQCGASANRQQDPEGPDPGGGYG
jgi:hypothetical protein